MTAFDNIKTNNWPATSNEFEDFLVLELPLNDAASLTQSRRDIFVGSQMLHQKVALTNSSTTSETPGDNHALVFRGAGAPKKHLENNTQTNGSFYSQSNHHVAGDASTDFWDWTFNPPIPNVTNVKVNSRHLNQHFNPYYYQVYDENDNAQVATPADKTSVTSDTEIYAGSAFNLKRIKMYGGAGGDDFFKIIVNGVTLNQNNGIGTVTEDDTHTSSTTYSTGIPKKHYDTNAEFGSNKYISIPQDSKFDLGTEPFTLECYVNTSDTSTGYPIIIGRWGSGGDSNFSNKWDLRPRASDNGGKWCFRVPDTSGTNGIIDGGATVTDGAWHHIAVSRSGNTWRMFTDGQLTNTVTNSNPIPALDGPLNLARGYNTLTGSIQDLRLYKGVAKYTSNFTPPGAILG
tara:strand:- start:1139 stop:2344 length:1206 start_codon:yes stop_codon:yes gene_type:complete